VALEEIVVLMLEQSGPPQRRAQFVRDLPAPDRVAAGLTHRARVVVFELSEQYDLPMEGTSIPARRSGARIHAATNEIRQQILSGAWANGRLLPSERNMAAQFGVARNTLRRIIRQLEAEGLIESHPGRGTFVRISPLGDRVSRVEALATSVVDGAIPDFVKRLRSASPADLMEARVLLEPLVAELAASRATAEDIAAIEALLKKAVSVTGSAELEHWDAQLHLAIFRAAGNDALLAWAEALTNAGSELGWHQRNQHSVTPELRSTYDREHTELVAALRDRDPDLARELVRKHMMRARSPAAFAVTE
jgi:GntR family transcriptional regulator, uxu operon transcriptional repressor